MTRPHETTTTLFDLGPAKLEVTATPGAGGPVVLAAHPADPLGAEAAALLAEAAGARAVCVNPRGVGASSAGVQSVEAMVDDLEAVRRAAGLGRVFFWGLSGGGFLGLAYAHRHPEALAGLVVDSACACLRARVADPACGLSPFHPSWREPLARRGLIEAGAHDRALDRSEWIDVDGVGSVFRRSNGPALLVAPFPISERMKDVMPALWAFDARPWLPTLKTRALVVGGGVDPVAPLSHVRALAEGLGAPLVVVEGAGHVPSTQGFPEVATAVRRFVHSPPDHPAR